MINNDNDAACVFYRQQELINKAEDLVDTVLKYSKNYLPTIARLCLISTFLEDGVRMWFQWNEQREYISYSWSVPLFLGTLFVIFNLFGQLVPCVFILLRKQVNIAVYILFGIVCLQTVAYKILWDFRFLLRNFSLAGGLILLLVENKPDAKSLFAGVPTLGDNKPKNYMQFAGRILVIFMFLTLIRLDVSVLHIIVNIVGTALIILVAVGYKTRLSALTLVFILTILNFFANPFWTVDSNKPLHDFLKYDFFQTLSVIGGLLFVVALGPGGVSLDEHKKRW
ncbi:surfeit locus 4 -like protein [Brachionus plicatilis]|uniref:Surfeit locus 4-like protein n=1 Tax=Brachionus plicatilis TaxID=10195 RepID=A0A3M7T698_BRAPC|nr:surfeit locus 4 -like protein [Brachionus plicatilis]